MARKHIIIQALFIKHVSRFSLVDSPPQMHLPGDVGAVIPELGLIIPVE